jgi:hypothetical protein
MVIHYFKLKYAKNYTTFCGGGWRDKMRKDIFIAERQLVNQYNSNESRSYSQELNRFSDMVWIRNLVLLHHFLIYLC